MEQTENETESELAKPVPVHITAVYVCIYMCICAFILFHASVETVLVGTSADAVNVLKLAPPAETSANGIVAFDGRSVAVDVKQDDVFGAGGLAPQFTIATWLRHKHGDDDRIKQHLMCSSDAEGQLLPCIKLDTV